MPESKSRCLIFICIWLDCKFFRIIACMSSAYVRWQAQSQSPQTSSSFSCSLSPSPQHYLCIPPQFSTCTHRPLYKQDLRKHGLWFPTAGHWAGRHLPPLPSYVLYWNNTGTRSAWGNWGTWGNTQPDNQPFLPLDLRSSEESQQGRERENLTPNSPLLVLQMEIEEHQNPPQGRSAACIKDEGDALKAEKKPAKEEKQRNREKSGKVAWISAREQRQSPGQISKRHGITERKVVTDATIQVCIQRGGKKSRVRKGGARTIC